MGHRARSSSAASGHGGWYSIAYPHVAVSLMPPLGGYSAGTPVTLRDGTHATLQVAALRPEGTVTSAPAPARAPRRAFVILPQALITLSGTGVTPRTARAMANLLRPL